MALRKYQTAESKYLELTATQPDKLSAIKSIIDNGFYAKTNIIDSPQDAQLQNDDTNNVSFLSDKMVEIRQDEDNRVSDLNILETNLNNNIVGKINDFGSQYDPLIPLTPFIETDGTNQFINDWEITKKITNVEDPIDDTDGVNTRFAQSKANEARDDLSNTTYPDLVRTDGTNQFVNDWEITKKVTNVNDATNSMDGVTRNQATTEFDNSENRVDTDVFILRDGSRSMDADLNMGGNRITELVNATDPKEAICKQQVDNINVLAQYKGIVDTNPPPVNQVLYEGDTKMTGVSKLTMLMDNDYLEGYSKSHNKGYYTISSDTIQLEKTDFEQISMTPAGIDDGEVVDSDSSILIIYRDDNTLIDNLSPDYFGVVTLYGTRGSLRIADNDQFLFFPVEMRLDVGYITPTSLSNCIPKQIHIIMKINAIYDKILERARVYFNNNNLTRNDILIMTSRNVRTNGMIDAKGHISPDSDVAILPWDRGGLVTISYDAQNDEYGMYIRGQLASTRYDTQTHTDDDFLIATKIKFWVVNKLAYTTPYNVYE